MNFVSSFSVLQKLRDFLTLRDCGLDGLPGKFHLPQPHREGANNRWAVKDGQGRLGGAGNGCNGWCRVGSDVFGFIPSITQGLPRCSSSSINSPTRLNAVMCHKRHDTKNNPVNNRMDVHFSSKHKLKNASE